MRHTVLAIIIALLAGAVITLLLIPVQLTNQQLWIVFFVNVLVVFLIVWSFNEFLIFRDVQKLNMLIKKLREGKIDNSEQNIKMEQLRFLEVTLKRYFHDKNLQVDDLEKKSDLRKQFIADVSHELKSPLFSAQGYVHTLLDGAIKDKEVRKKFLKKSARNLDYIDILIQDLLVLSQIESEAIRMIPDHFDLIGLVEEVLDDQESKAAKSAISLTLEQDKSPMIVYADYSRIRQVLTNLVNNGINYTKAGGKVSVKLEDKEKEVKITVNDDGVGIAEKYHTRIFNRFFRIDKSRTVKKSTGLGLAIVKHILERHNTSISVESSPGEGSSFIFVLAKDKWTEHEAEQEL